MAGNSTAPAWRRATARVVRPLLLVEYRLALPPPSRPPLAAGIDLRPPRGDDEPTLAPLLRGADGVGARLARGEWGVIAEVAGAPVGCAWATTAPLRLFGYGLRVAPASGE